MLSYKSGHFDLTSALARGTLLLVGEGNLSFALSLAGIAKFHPRQITATTYETEQNLTNDAISNATALRYSGVAVINGVDATNLRANFGSERFDNIAFQFPNTGSREPIEGRNPNFVLIREFLESASGQLTQGGKVFITAVDSPYYEGAFHFDEAAKITGFKAPVKQPFNPDDFPGYEHSMTNEDESAIDDYDKFATWIFQLQ